MLNDLYASGTILTSVLQKLERLSRVRARSSTAFRRRLWIRGPYGPRRYGPAAPGEIAAGEADGVIEATNDEGKARRYDHREPLVQADDDAQKAGEFRHLFLACRPPVFRRGTTVAISRFLLADGWGA